MSGIREIGPIGFPKNDASCTFLGSTRMPRAAVAAVCRCHGCGRSRRPRRESPSVPDRDPCAEPTTESPGEGSSRFFRKLSSRRSIGSPTVAKQPPASAWEPTAAGATIPRATAVSTPWASFARFSFMVRISGHLLGCRASRTGRRPSSRVRASLRLEQRPHFRGDSAPEDDCHLVVVLRPRRHRDNPSSVTPTRTSVARGGSGALRRERYAQGVAPRTSRRWLDGRRWNSFLGSSTVRARTCRRPTTRASSFAHRTDEETPSKERAFRPSATTSLTARRPNTPEEETHHAKYPWPRAGGCDLLTACSRACSCNRADLQCLR